MLHLPGNIPVMLCFYLIPFDTPLIISDHALHQEVVVITGLFFSGTLQVSWLCKTLHVIVITSVYALQ